MREKFMGRRRKVLSLAIKATGGNQKLSRFGRGLGDPTRIARPNTVRVRHWVVVVPGFFEACTLRISCDHAALQILKFGGG